MSYTRDSYSNKSLSWYQLFNCLTNKMVKHTQTIMGLLSTNYLSVLDQFLGLALKELKRYASSLIPLFNYHDTTHTMLKFQVHVFF